MGLGSSLFLFSAENKSYVIASNHQGNPEKNGDDV
jgi:hypothetical protein